MQTLKSEAASAIDRLAHAQNIVVVCHFDPDGDAIGSLLGLGLALRAMDKAVVLACDDPVPWNLTFLPGSDTVVQALPPGAFDLAVVVDSSDARRVGRVGAEAMARGAPLINIDHHVTNTRFGQVNVVDPDAASASEIVYNLLRAMGHALDADTATCLLTGLVTDTRGFRTANVNQRVLRTAADLMDAGAPLATITQLALDRRSFSALAMMGRALDKVRFEDGVIWSAMDLDEIRALDTNGTGARPRNISSLLNAVDGANVAVFFAEKPDGAVDISMRAKPGFDLTALYDEGQALHQQGGGHPLASGAEVNAPLATVVSQVVDALKALVREQTQARETAADLSR
ncbi:MAG: bifunctional oligoribonuclease/PAP phosphatase NrnA [Anaerolineae bacterium]